MPNSTLVTLKSGLVRGCC